MAENLKTSVSGMERLEAWPQLRGTLWRRKLLNRSQVSVVVEDLSSPLMLGASLVRWSSNVYLALYVRY